MAAIATIKMVKTVIVLALLLFGLAASTDPSQSSSSSRRNPLSESLIPEDNNASSKSKGSKLKLAWPFGKKAKDSIHVRGDDPEQFLRAVAAHKALIDDAKANDVRLPIETVTIVDHNPENFYTNPVVNIQFVKPHTGHVGATSSLAQIQAAAAADDIRAGRLASSSKVQEEDLESDGYVQRLIREQEEAARNRSPQEAKKQYDARLNRSLWKPPRK